MEIRALQWDSDFFGLRIGRADILSTEDALFLAAQHEELKRQFDLLYIFDPNNIGFTANGARLVSCIASLVNLANSMTILSFSSKSNRPRTCIV